MVLPVHQNCREIVEAFRQRNVDAIAYPRRSTDGADVNCWNKQANQIEGLGLPVVSAVCPTCEFKKRCEEDGYLFGVKRARKSPVAIATHARGVVQHLDNLAQDRNYIAIHESAVELLRPTISVTQDELREMHTSLDRILGKRIASERVTACDQEVFLTQLKCVLEEAERIVDAAEVVTQFPSIGFGSPVELKPQTLSGVIRTLFRDSRQRMQGRAWQVLLALATQQLCHAYAVVHPVHRRGGVKAEARTLLAAWSNPVPSNIPVWICDATIDRSTISNLLPSGIALKDVTPMVRPPQLHKVTQIPQDITKGTDKRKASVTNPRNNVLQICRGILAELPAGKTVGVIHHREHLDQIEELRRSDSRIVRSCYFWEGPERSSNDWKSECDVILVLGTPRPGPDAVRHRLLVMGEIDAAAIPDPVWESYCWIGKSESGTSVTVNSSRYQDADWQRAFVSLCRAELTQCVGRGRTVCHDGIDVIVVSTEECGLLIADNALRKMTETETKVLETLRQESKAIAKLNSLAKGCDSSPGGLVRTGVIANSLKISGQSATKYLKSLEARKLAKHCGKAGWLPTCEIASAD